jgi:hypothetical protein
MGVSKDLFIGENMNLLDGMGKAAIVFGALTLSNDVPKLRRIGVPDSLKDMSEDFSPFCFSTPGDMSSLLLVSSISDAASFIAAERATLPRLGDSYRVVPTFLRDGVSEPKVGFSNISFLTTERIAEPRRGVWRIVEVESLMGLWPLVGDGNRLLIGLMARRGDSG